MARPAEGPPSVSDRGTEWLSRLPVQLLARRHSTQPSSRTRARGVAGGVEARATLPSEKTLAPSCGAGARRRRRPHRVATLVTREACGAVIGSLLKDGEYRDEGSAPID